jgi:pimeloyl-ACP methyl ester carboxylesterase
MTPVYFDGCLGQLHEAPGDVAVIMCGAPGYEQLCAQRGWRLLADMLAGKGYPTLRFDWRGCGDSLGDDLEPARVASWRRNLEQAIAFARGALAPRKIIVVGLRFGATLAADVAATMGGVDGLALIDPGNGRRYGRELAGLARTMAPVDPDVTDDGVIVGGFHYTAETLREMAGIDPRAATQAPAARALILSPGGRADIDAIATNWRALGCDVDTMTMEGLVDWLAEPTFSVTPREALDGVVAWVARYFESHARVATPAPPPARLDGDGFVETPILFGASNHLFGVLCEPIGVRRDGRVTLFLNAGANPHIGWARMNVDAARRLARAGKPSLRMDVAGLGDSAPEPGRRAQVIYDLAVTADLGAAIDRLKALGYDDVMIVGLCSGAHAAFHCALADARVSGVVMVNLKKFIWRDDYSLALAAREEYRSSGAYWRDALKPGTYLRVLRGEVDLRGIGREIGRRVGRLGGRLVLEASRLVREGDDETARVRRWFRQLSERGARVLLVYSADDSGFDELKAHMGAGARRLRKLRGFGLAILEKADHNLTQRAPRARLNELVLALLNEAAPPRVGP